MEDFDRFVAACAYPGALSTDVVEENLKEYLRALGIERQVVRLERGWDLANHPSLKRYAEALLEDFKTRTDVHRLMAMNGKDDQNAHKVWIIQGRRVVSVRDVQDDAHARAELRAMQDVQDASAVLKPWNARNIRDAKVARYALSKAVHNLPDAAKAARCRRSADIEDARIAQRALIINTTDQNAMSAKVVWDATSQNDQDAQIHALTCWCLQTCSWWYWRFDLSWLATIHLGAVQVSNLNVDVWARPLFEAFISGAWLLHWTDDTLYWIAKPTLRAETINEQRRLHSSDSAALESDIEDLYFWHGVPVPATVILHPDLITVEDVETEVNVEVRRAMVERMGYDRYILESGARRIHHDETGDLYFKGMQDDEPLVTVYVVNSTVEPDGTFRKYMLRVPPNMTRAREAVAWTFGLAEDDYHPTIET